MDLRTVALILCLIPSIARAESVASFGALGFVSLSKKISKYGSLTLFHRDVFAFDEKSIRQKDFPAGWIQTYFQAVYVHQYRPSVNFGMGYVFQENLMFEADKTDEHRLMEQVTLLSRHRAFSMTHRFRYEQRFVAEALEPYLLRTRFRYQIGVKMPFRGIEIDSNEFYLNAYNEFYFSLTGKKNALFSDDWFYAGIGLKTESSGSFEMGPLLQWSVVNTGHDSRAFLNVQFGWVYEFSDSQ